MLVNDLFEARDTLPLRKDLIRFVRGSYSPLLAVMNPMDFLRLTSSERDLKILKTHKFPELNEVDPKHRYDATRADMPFLEVLYPSGKVVGHEGRHRALMVMRAGGTRFPVALQFRTDMSWLVSYEEYDSRKDEEDSEDKQRVFDNADEARAFADQLRELNKNLDNPIGYHGIHVQTLGGSILRGHPTRSDFKNWKYAAWTPSDMPPYLLSEVDPSVRIPTSTMRIGVVKGYHHYDKTL